MEKSLKVNCPTCKKVFHYFDSGFRPFCCERCRMVDLGHWFEESYAVPGEKIQNQSKDFIFESDGEEAEEDFKDDNQDDENENSER